MLLPVASFQSPSMAFESGLSDWNVLAFFAWQQVEGISFCFHFRLLCPECCGDFYSMLMQQWQYRLSWPLQWEEGEAARRRGHDGPWCRKMLWRTSGCLGQAQMGEGEGGAWSVAGKPTCEAFWRAQAGWQKTARVRGRHCSSCDCASLPRLSEPAAASEVSSWRSA